MLAHFIQLGKRRIACRMTHQQQVAISHDGLQQVIEIMRDAARELSDRLHLLRLGKLRLQCPLLGSVDQIKYRARLLAGRRAQRAGE